MAHGLVVWELAWADDVWQAKDLQKPKQSTQQSANRNLLELAFNNQQSSAINLQSYRKQMTYLFIIIVNNNVILMTTKITMQLQTLRVRAQLISNNIRFIIFVIIHCYCIVAASSVVLVLLLFNNNPQLTFKWTVNVNHQIISHTIYCSVSSYSRIEFAVCSIAGWEVALSCPKSWREIKQQAIDVKDVVPLVNTQDPTLLTTYQLESHTAILQTIGQTFIYCILRWVIVDY